VFVFFLLLINGRISRLKLTPIASIPTSSVMWEIKCEISRTEQNFHKLFYTPLDGRSNVSDGLFYDYDLVIKERIIKRTVSSLSPIYTGLVSNHEAEVIVKWISNADFCAEYDTIASTDEKESYFKPVTYWRGPI
jgi:glycogen debranching enzyme